MVTTECFEWKSEGDGGEWDVFEVGGLITGACPSCGAEFYGGKETVDMLCPCCGKAKVVEKRLLDMMKPDYIIPFRYNETAAQDALIEFCGDNNRLLPNTFIMENRVESVQGVYVPFWLFNALAEGVATFEATKAVRKRSGKSSYTVIYHYFIDREGSIAFKNIPVDGSEKMDDEYMDAIEPFNYKEMQAFHPSLLAGYTAEKCDVDAERSKRRAEARIKRTVEDRFLKSVRGYDSVTPTGSSIKIKNGTVSHGLFPVWVLNTVYKYDNFLFMMNGQTGKFVGRLPVDNVKAWKYRALYTVGIGVPLALLICFLLLLLDKTDTMHLRGAASPIPLLFAALVSLAYAAKLGFSKVSKWKKAMNTAAQEEAAFEYEVQGSLRYKAKNDTFLYTRTAGSGFVPLDVPSLLEFLDARAERKSAEWVEILREKPAPAFDAGGDEADSWVDPLRKKTDADDYSAKSRRKKQKNKDSEAEFICDVPSGADSEEEFLCSVPSGASSAAAQTGTITDARDGQTDKTAVG